MTFAYNRRTFLRYLIFACLIAALYRFLAVTPLPFSDEAYAAANSGANDVLALLTAKTQTLSYASLGISPYIYATLFVQFLTVFISSFSDLQKGGETGQRKIMRLTLYLSFGLALVQSAWFVFQHMDTSTGFNFRSWIDVLFVWLIAAFVPSMFAYIIYRIGDTKYGDGISLFLTINIVSTFPSYVHSIFTIKFSGICIALASVVILFIAVGIVINSRFELPLAYSRKMPNGHNKNDVLSIRLLSGGVMPIIFASGMMNVFYTLTNASVFNMNTWFTDNILYSMLGIIIYFIFALTFTKVIRYISFNERELSENLRRQGCVIRGVAQGEMTNLYLKKAFSKLNIIDALIITIISIFPIVVQGIMHNAVILPSGGAIILLGTVFRTYFMARKSDKESLKCSKTLMALQGSNKFELFKGRI